MASPKLCAIAECGKSAEWHGLCRLHYYRWLRYDDPLRKPLRRPRKLGKLVKTRHPLYPTWWAMLYRCNDEYARGYCYYGARGVTVCKRWRDDFWAFVEDMPPKPSPEHTLDRWPDKNGNYEPGNVRWATPVQQARNRRVRSNPQKTQRSKSS